MRFRYRLGFAPDKLLFTNAFPVHASSCLQNSLLLRCCMILYSLFLLLVMSSVRLSVCFVRFLLDDAISNYVINCSYWKMLCAWLYMIVVGHDCSVEIVELRFVYFVFMISFLVFVVWSCYFETVFLFCCFVLFHSSMFHYFVNLSWWQ